MICKNGGVRAKWLKSCKTHLFCEREPLNSCNSPVRRQLKSTVTLSFLANSPEKLAAQNKGM